MGDASIAKSANVHKSAVIGAGAVIGEDVTIAPYAVIGPGVEIGARSFIGAHTHIDCTLMGEDCHIKPGAVIGGAGFGVTADEKGIIDIPHSGRVVLGNRVSIGIILYKLLIMFKSEQVRHWRDMLVSQVAVSLEKVFS